MKKKLLFFSFIVFQFFAFAQEDAWVFLNAKANVANALANPQTILTQDAIDRKNNHGITIDFRDVPVDESYITQLKSATGITVMAKSKWFNAVHVRGTETNINNLLIESFVDHIEFANRSLNARRSFVVNNKFEIEDAQITFVYGNTQNQVEMINADGLHLLDYTGTGMVIAVLDAGFPNVNTMGSFQRLRDAGNLRDGYDFVNRDDDEFAYSGNNHGTKVLSDMAGFIENAFVGTAPDASYYLFRTEDAGSENPIEESYWVEAAERADSLGVDVINTSLGYKDFDNPNYDYTSADMNGLTAFITRGANIAFEKGLLLVNSAGNSGASGVNAPADSANVLSIGAVDSNGNYASFSSQGSAIQPTQKPDVVARGSGSYVIDDSNNIVQNNGTSFSSPIMAGGVTCLWQALPNKTNAEIMQLVRESASQYATPDYFLGFGIPDLQQALNSALSIGLEEEIELSIYPNPIQHKLNIVFAESIENISLKLYNILGKQIINKTIYKNKPSINLESLSSGIYIVKLQADNKKSKTFKLIKE
ncbi:MAG: serine protease [Bacteroidetes bacterium]|nr:MAG: serine protease [Bacteroidota bacterium]